MEANQRTLFVKIDFPLIVLKACSSLARRSKSPAQFATVFVVHVENSNSHATDRCSAVDQLAASFKMFRPNLRARVKQRHELAGLSTRDVWALVKVALVAREAEI